jgi:hypothetical protein
MFQATNVALAATSRGKNDEPWRSDLLRGSFLNRHQAARHADGALLMVARQARE